MNITYFRQRKSGPEVNLEDAVVNCIPHYFDDHGYKLWAGGSVPIGAGVPDIVIAAYKRELIAFNNAEAPSIQILAYLRSVGGARLDTISTRTGLSQRFTAKLLDHLIQSQAVIDKSSVFSISPVWRCILLEIVSIEAKVTNWRRAFAQASRNLIFSHRSFVALPEEIAERLKSHPILQHFGIGLLAITSKKEVRMIRRGRSTKPSVWSYYYQIASYVAMNCE